MGASSMVLKMEVPGTKDGNWKSPVLKMEVTKGPADPAVLMMKLRL